VNPVSLLAILEQQVSDVAIPSPPGTALTIYNSLEQGGLATKDASGTVSPIGAGGGSGNVTGPSSSVDKTLPRFNGTNGRTIQGSGITVDDSDNVAVPNGSTIDGRDVSEDGAKLDGIDAGAQRTSFVNVKAALAAATSAIDSNGQQFTCTAAPSGSTSLCNKAYVDALASGHVITNGALVRASGAISHTGLAQTIDGVAIDTDGYRVFDDGNANHVLRGLWVAHSGAWTRPTDFATGSHANGASIFVSSGTLYGSTSWGCNTSNPNDVVDTDPLAFTQTSAPGSFLAGTGLTLTGNTFSVTTPVTEGNIRTALAAATANITVNDKKISTAAVPTAGPDLVNKTYADALVVGLASTAYVDASVAPTYTGSFTSTSTTASVIQNIPLDDDTLTRIVFVVIARDTSTHWFKKKSSTEWTRSSGGSAAQDGIEDGPAAVDNITITGATIVANGNGVDLKFGGSNSVHTAGSYKVWIEKYPIAAAT
jgi:hypothetical protein